jgi:uncharacterized membrane protein
MGKAATPGYCPYCKTPLNAGATACTGCSAFETTEWAELGMWKNSLLGFCFFVGPLLSVLFFLLSWVLGLIVLIGSPVSYFLIRSRKKRKMTWAIGGRRVI